MPKFDNAMSQPLPGVAFRQKLTYERNLLPFSKELVQAYRSLSHSPFLPESDRLLADSLLSLNDPQVEYFLEIYEHWRTCKADFPDVVKTFSKEFSCRIGSLGIYTCPCPLISSAESSFMQTLDELINIHEQLRARTNAFKDELEILKQTLEEFKLEAPHLLEHHRYEYITTFIELVLLETSIGLGSGYVELLRIQMEICSRRINMAKSQLDMAAKFESFYTSSSKKPLCLNSEDEEGEIESTPQIVSTPKYWLTEIFTRITCMHLLGISVTSALYFVGALWYW